MFDAYVSVIDWYRARILQREKSKKIRKMEFNLMLDAKEVLQARKSVRQVEKSLNNFAIISNDGNLHCEYSEYAPYSEAVKNCIINQNNTITVNASTISVQNILRATKDIVVIENMLQYQNYEAARSELGIMNLRIGNRCNCPFPKFAFVTIKITNIFRNNTAIANAQSRSIKIINDGISYGMHFMSLYMNSWLIRQRLSNARTQQEFDDYCIIYDINDAEPHVVRMAIKLLYDGSLVVPVAFEHPLPCHSNHIRCECKIPKNTNR